MEVAVCSDSTHSFAKQAASIPEIRDIICEFVNLSDDSIPGLEKTLEAAPCLTLARLLITSHDFFYSAARLLWGTRTIEAKDLLVFLPGVVKKRWRNSHTTSAMITNDLSDSPLDVKWDRFVLYAAYVKRLRSSLVVYLHKSPQDLNLIRAYAKSHTLLPNLVTLSTKGPTYSTGDDSASTLLDWLEILVSPSLQKLDLSHSQSRDSFSPTIVNRFYQFIQGTMDQCPQLKSLSYCYGGVPTTHYPTFLHGHAIVPDHITHLRCRFAVFCPELLAWLAGMHSLQRIEFNELDGFHSAFNDTSLSEQFHAFSSLEHLVLVDSWVGPTVQLFQSPLVKNLTRLDIRSTVAQGWLSDAILTICQQLAGSCPRLQELSLGFPPNQFLISALCSLRLINLRALSVPRANRKMLGGPRVVRDIIQLWPSLNMLDLRSYDASFEDLGHIIPFCPQLSVLRLGVEINIPFGISNTRFAPAPRSVVPQRHLTIVSSYEHPRQSHELPELDELAKYLSHLRPCTSFWTCNDLQQPWVFRRYKWLKYLNMQLDKHSQEHTERQGSQS